MYARQKIDELKLAGVECVPLSTRARVWAPARFKRSYAAEAEESLPYLSSYDVFEYIPTAKSHLSVRRTQKLDTYLLRRGCILQTCSGRNLGPAAMVDRYLERFILSHDMIRIDVDDEDFRYYVLAYLQSPIGQELLKRDKTGSVIDHISDSHVRVQDIPLLGTDVISLAADAMKKAVALREEARIVLDDIQTQYEQTLPMLRRDSPTKKGWTTRSVMLGQRIDAASYDPLAAQARKALQNAGGMCVKEVAEVIKPAGRYKTIYVEQEYGRPILSGGQLLEEHIINLRYISPRAFGDVHKYELQQDWIAYQADGRVERGLGTPVLITRDRDGWLASGHVGRLKPKDGVDAGWLYVAARTWHAQIQLKSLASGSVVDSTFPEDMESVILPPPNTIDGARVRQAWETFVQAQEEERKAISVIGEAIDNATS